MVKSEQLRISMHTIYGVFMHSELNETVREVSLVLRADN